MEVDEIDADADADAELEVEELESEAEAEILGAAVAAAATSSPRIEQMIWKEGAAMAMMAMETVRLMLMLSCWKLWMLQRRTVAVRMEENI
jgi:hypothetical protein